MSGCTEEDQDLNRDSEVTLSTINGDGEDPAFIPPIGPGTDWPTFDCYSGGIKIDADCDGSFELGWNFTASTVSECICITNERVQIAIQNGWCYDFNPENCLLSKCWRAVDNCAM